MALLTSTESHYALTAGPRTLESYLPVTFKKELINYLVELRVSSLIERNLLLIVFPMRIEREEH